MTIVSTHYPWRDFVAKGTHCRVISFPENVEMSEFYSCQGIDQKSGNYQGKNLVRENCLLLTLHTVKAIRSQ